jgi:hypothetical protein
MSPSRTKKTSGGQPRNVNHLHHGFYGHLYTLDEEAALAADPVSIDDEQRLLRTRVLRLAAQLKLSRDFDKDLHGLQVLLHIIQTIAALERTKLVARGKDGELSESILEALASLDPDAEL